MIKLIALLKRKPGMTREDFRKRWLIEHTKLSSKLPGCLEYRINIATEHQPEGDETEPLYDGTAELWWESMEAMERSFGTGTAKIAGNDADSFCEVRIHIYTEEHIVVKNGTCSAAGESTMTAISKKPKICVAGACNIDLISYVPRMPAIGETLHGIRFHMGFGGKGANQAVMAAKIGADVTMIAKLGDDAFGRNTLENFKSLGIDVSHVHFTDKAFSGVAPITVDPEGRNAIIIVTGANDLLTGDEVEAARPAIAVSSAMVCQLEIPLEISMKALTVAREEGIMTIFNPAPARKNLPEELYRLSDVFCPNESETALLTGLPVKTDEQAEKAAREIIARGAKAVILTLGERGALIVDRNSARHVKAAKVKAVDSTGAGDSFVGSLAYFLARGTGLDSAVERACRIATMSVLKPGTQTSFPAAEEVRDILDS